jgi:dienelactone hydrolase
MKFSRRKILSMGLPLISGAALSNTFKWSGSGDQPDGLPKSPWPQQRKQIERSFLDLLGEFPTNIPPLLPEMKRVFHEDGITRYHVTFQSEENDRVTAWLLVPDAALDKPTPAMICIHSTTFGSGKDSAIGLSGRRPVDPPRDPIVGNAYGRDLARHGFITLSIDLLTDGERIKPGERVMDTRGFYRRNPEWSIVGKNTWDVMRSVDFLQTLDFVDKDQIGVIGWSLGGHSALFASAFEPRLAATVTIGGILDWHRRTTHWARPDNEKAGPNFEKNYGFKPDFGPYIYIRKFRPYIADQTKELAIDFDDLMKMVAPRPLLVLSSEVEFDYHHLIPKCANALELYMNWEDAAGLPSPLTARINRTCYQDTLHAYGSEESVKTKLTRIKAGDCFSWFSYPGGHGFPPVARHYSFAWLDRWLGRAKYSAG